MDHQPKGEIRHRSVVMATAVALDANAIHPPRGISRAALWAASGALYAVGLAERGCDLVLAGRQQKTLDAVVNAVRQKAVSR